MKTIDVIRPGSLKAIIGPAGTLKRIIKNRSYFLSEGLDISIYNHDSIATGKPAEIPTLQSVVRKSATFSTKLKSKLRMFAKYSYILSLLLANKGYYTTKCLVKYYLQLNRNPDIVVFHSYMECYYYLKLRKNHDPKVVVFYHSDGLPNSMGETYFPKLKGSFYEASINNKFLYVAENANKCVFIAQKGCDNFLNNYPQISKDKTYVMLNGIEDFTAEELNYIKSVKISNPHEFRLICTGTINRRKGQRIILEALAKLNREKLNKISIELVGDGPERMELEQFVKGNNLSNNVKFSGSIDNRFVYQHLAQNNIYILMSHNEGLPISIIEAMRIGLPIISTKIAGIPELVNKTNGILIDPDVNQLYAILDNLESFEWSKMGKMSRKRFEEEFTFERMRKQYCGMINSI